MTIDHKHMAALVGKHVTVEYVDGTRDTRGGGQRRDFQALRALIGRRGVIQAYYLWTPGLLSVSIDGLDGTFPFFASELAEVPVEAEASGEKEMGG